ncbi:C-type lectin domain family 9 member A-like [Hemitrygon akajei]|uniref:C-type lectin domain family 9 member A-like n=1 Tax=Hemitrygon akajei TaxID=2704970 RepID=UPI003BFA2275
MPTTAQTGAHEQQSKVKIGNRPYRLICLLCLVTFSLIVIVAVLSIHVSQIHQSLKRKHSDLRHQFCEFLTSRREQNCSANWIKNNNRCYYVSTLETSFSRAMQECSNRDSRLLEINSRDEASFVSQNLVSRNLEYWIGKCEDGTVGFRLVYKGSFETSSCNQCDPTAVRRIYACDRDQRFICEKPASLFPDIPKKIQDLCQQPVEAT